MKYLTIFACLWISCSFIKVAAQTRVSGTILNAREEPLLQANILLLKATDSSLVKGAAASKHGQFSFENVRPGNYLVMATCSGYMSRYLPGIIIEEGETTKDLQSVRLEDDIKELGAVNLQSRRPLLEQKLDRLVVNVKNSITSVGSTALDILERSPGVIVNRQANTVSMSGKSGVTVMINGKISHMPLAALVQMLEGMNAGSIDRIELITTPPSNLDAQGNAGYINIILLNNPDFGFNGSFTSSIGYGDGLTTAHNVSFNYRKNKLNLFGDYSMAIDKRQPFFENYRRTTEGGKIRESFTNTDRSPERLSQNARFGIDLQLTPKTVMGILASGFMNKYTMHETILNENYLNQQRDTLVRVNNSEVNNWRNADVNVNVQHTIKTGEMLSADFNYLVYHNKQPFTYRNAYSDGTGQPLFIENVRTGKKTPIRFWVGKLDYSKTLKAKTSIEAGIKFTTSRFDNDVRVERSLNNNWKVDSLYTSSATLREDISAAYLALNITPNEKTNLKLGLRYEFTNSNLGTVAAKNIVDRHYGRLFPSFFFSRKLREDQSLNFSYSRRINRPAFTDLAPFIFFFDPNTFLSGNSALQPAINDNFMIGYTLKKYLFSLSYSYEDNSIAAFQSRIDPKTNKQVLFAQNLDALQTVSLILAAPFTLRPWWSIQANASGIWQQVNIEDDKERLTVKQANVNLRLVQSFTLPANFSMELNGTYQSPSIFGRYKVNAYSQLDFGIQKKMKNHNEKIRLAYTNIFSSYKMVWQTVQQEDNFSKTTLQFSKATVQLTYSRNFGRNSVKAARDRNGAAAEERGRVR